MPKDPTRPLPPSITQWLKAGDVEMKNAGSLPWDDYAHRYYHPSAYEPFGFTLPEWRKLNWLLDHFNPGSPETAGPEKAHRSKPQSTQRRNR